MVVADLTDAMEKGVCRPSVRTWASESVGSSNAEQGCRTCLMVTHVAIVALVQTLHLVVLSTRTTLIFRLRTTLMLGLRITQGL